MIVASFVRQCRYESADNYEFGGGDDVVPTGKILNRMGYSKTYLYDIDGIVIVFDWECGRIMYMELCVLCRALMAVEGMTSILHSFRSSGT